MANNTTSERLWILDTAGEIQAALGIPVIVRKVLYLPAAVDNAITIQEYGPTGALRTAIYLKADPAVARPVEQDFGPDGRFLNGFKLSAISAGSLYVYLGTG